MFNKYVWYTAPSLSIFLILITATGTSSKLANNVYAQNGGYNMTQPETGQTIAWQGTVSSFKDPLKGHESHQVAVILPPREDQAVYSGVISFIASKPVEVVTLHDYTLGNMSIPDKFGVVMKAPTPWRRVVKSLQP